MAEFVIPAAVGLTVMLVVWFTANFLGKPFIRFYQLKDEIQSSLILYANVSPVYESSDPKEHPDWDRFLEAQRVLRRLASELNALALNHHRLNRVLAYFGYQLEDATSGLIGFGNTLADPKARRRGELAWNRDAVERSLKLRLTYPKGIEVREDE